MLTGQLNSNSAHVLQSPVVNNTSQRNCSLLASSFHALLPNIPLLGLRAYMV